VNVIPERPIQIGVAELNGVTSDAIDPTAAAPMLSLGDWARGNRSALRWSNSRTPRTSIATIAFTAEQSCAGRCAGDSLVADALAGCALARTRMRSCQQ